METSGSPKVVSSPWPTYCLVSHSADILISDYALGLGLSNQNQLASYRFRPSTGEIQIIDASLEHPNGIVFSRDGKTLYISDTGLETVSPNARRGKGNF